MKTRVFGPVGVGEQAYLPPVISIEAVLTVCRGNGAAGYRCDPGNYTVSNISTLAQAATFLPCVSLITLVVLLTTHLALPVCPPAHLIYHQGLLKTI